MIAQMKRRLNPVSKRSWLGIGDDAAVVRPPSKALLATVDRLTEGVHFDLRYSSAESVGYKALAVSLSDIASMGGRPLYGLISLSLPRNRRGTFVDKLYRGIRKLSQSFGVDVVGGNLSRSGKEVIIDTTVLGEPTGNILYRSGAKVGDRIFVTGSLGKAAAGLECLRRWGKKAQARFPSLTAAQLVPSPCVLQGHELSKIAGVHACIDISDGLSSELYHLAEASKVGIELVGSCLPISEETHKAARVLKKDPKVWAINGGEDYQLLFTASPKTTEIVKNVFRRKSWSVSEIGIVKAQGFGVRLESETGLQKLPKGGWVHF